MNQKITRWFNKKNYLQTKKACYKNVINLKRFDSSQFFRIKLHSRAYSYPMKASSVRFMVSIANKLLCVDERRSKCTFRMEIFLHVFARYFPFTNPHHFHWLTRIAKHRVFSMISSPQKLKYIRNVHENIIVHFNQIVYVSAMFCKPFQHHSVLIRKIVIWINEISLNNVVKLFIFFFDLSL